MDNNYTYTHEFTYETDMLWSLAAMLKAVVPIIFAEIPTDDRDRFWLRGTPSADTWPSESTGFFMERWGKWYDERRRFRHLPLYSIEPVWFKTSETPTFTSTGVIEEILRRLGQLKIPEVHDFERSPFGDTDGSVHRGYRLHHSPCRGLGFGDIAVHHVLLEMKIIPCLTTEPPPRT